MHHIPIEVAIADGYPPKWITIHVQTGIDRNSLAKRCALLLGVNPDEYPSLARADRANSIQDDVKFLQPKAKFILFQKMLESPPPIGVLSCGEDNSKGQLGRDGKINIYKCIPGLVGRRVVQISAGEEHTAFVLQTGILMTCGNYLFGRLGLGKSINENQLIPRRVEFSNGKTFITHSFCSSTRTFCLTNLGDIYSFGQAGSCLGIENYREDQWTPTRIELLEKPIINLSASDYRIIACDKNYVYCWGDSKDSYRPNIISSNYSSTVVKMVAAGIKQHSFSLLAYEDGSFGELSYDMKNINILPHLKSELFKEYSIGCGSKYNCIVSNDGIVTLIDCEKSFLEIDQMIVLKRKAKKVFLGLASNILLISDSNASSVFTYGGQLPVGNLNEFSVDLDCIHLAAVGLNHFVLLQSCYIAPYLDPHQEEEEEKNPCGIS